MQLPDWKPLTSTDEKRFSEAKLQFESALQWVAYMERSYVQPGNGEALYLHWLNDKNGMIATGDFAGNYGLGMRVNNLMMQFSAAGAPERHKIELDERSPAEVEAWILSELLHRGIDRSKFSKTLPYDLTGLMSGDDLDFSPGEYEAELGKISSLFQFAAHNICNAAVELGLVEKSECHFRISPQSLNLEIDTPDHVFGFSLGDKSGQDSPCFYTRPAGRAEETLAGKKVLKITDLPEEAPAQAILDFFRQETRPN